MKIKQIEESDVFTALCEGKAVYRFNTETGASSDLRVKAIKTIAHDFNDQRFLYFTVSK